MHCHRGMSRSASLVIAFKMKHRNMSLGEAFDRTKACRSCIRPNDGFLGQLHKYELTVHGRRLTEDIDHMYHL